MPLVFTNSVKNWQAVSDRPAALARNIRLRHHDLLDHPVTAKGQEALLDIAQHCIRPVAEHRRRRTREGEDAAGEIAGAHWVAALDLDSLTHAKPRAD